MDKKVKKIIDGAMSRRVLSALEIKDLLALPVTSEESLYARYAALEINNQVIEKVGNKACIELTGKTAEILFAAWEEVADARTGKPASDINNNSHPE